MNTEQIFFESFNIPKRFYTTINLGDLDNNYQEVSAKTLQELFERYNFWFDEYAENIKDFHDWEEKYPLITPDIVLNLITVLVKKHCNITLYWGLPKLTKQILKQCIRDKNDKEIQDQIRELFNDK